MIVLLISSLVLVLGFSLDSSPSSGGQGSKMAEFDLKSGRETLDAIPEEELEEDPEEEYDTHYVDSSGVGDMDEKDRLGDLACLPAELRVLVYRQYFFGDGACCHVRRSTRDILCGSREDTEDNLTTRPCTIAHSLASNINGVSLLLANKQIHAESLPELYSQAHFRFDRLCPLQHFLSATPPSSLAHVRRLRFEWVTYTFIYGSEYVATYVERIWGPVWARLVGLEGLRELTVTVRPGWAGGWTVLGAARERCEDLLFGPVRRLEGGGVVLRCETC